MYDNLPFRYCNDDELDSVLSVVRNRVKPRYETMTRNITLAQQFNVMLTECLTNKEKIL